MMIQSIIAFGIFFLQIELVTAEAKTSIDMHINHHLVIIESLKENMDMYFMLIGS
jgi:hypothetical protein